MKLLVRHLFRIHQVAVQRVELQPAHHVRHLVERPVIARKRTPHLGEGVVAFVADLIDEQIDALFGRPVAEVKIQRKYDACRPVRTPEQRPDLVLGRLGKTTVPQQKFPIQCPALGVERRSEIAAVRPVTLAHKPLQVMAGNEFVMGHGACKMRVIAAHRHQLLLVRHAIGRVTNEYRLAAQKEGRHQLPFGRHHLHSPTVASDLRHGHEVVLLDVFDRLIGQPLDQLGLTPRLDECLLDGLDRL